MHATTKRFAALPAAKVLTRGFSLVETLIALAIGSLLLAGIYNFYISQKQAYALRERIAEMQQSARIGMTMMVREIRMAGYDPTGTAGAGVVTATAELLRVTMDLNGDGDTHDANEDIRYALYDSGGDGDLDLGRKPDAGNPQATQQPVAENIESLHFVYTLADGTETDNPADPSQIRAVQITLTARTAKPDPKYPANNGYRTYRLRSMVTLRNLTWTK